MVVVQVREIGEAGAAEGIRISFTNVLLDRIKSQVRQVNNGALGPSLSCHCANFMHCRQW